MLGISCAVRTWYGILHSFFIAVKTPNLTKYGLFRRRKYKVIVALNTEASLAFEL
jgi:hypothetical protein